MKAKKSTGGLAGFSGAFLFHYKSSFKNTAKNILPFKYVQVSVSGVLPSPVTLF